VACSHKPIYNYRSSNNVSKFKKKRTPSCHISVPCSTFLYKCFSICSFSRLLFQKIFGHYSISQSYQPRYFSISLLLCRPLVSAPSHIRFSCQTAVICLQVNGPPLFIGRISVTLTRNVKPTQQSFFFTAVCYHTIFISLALTRRF
jgi:hypothetical protein